MVKRAMTAGPATRRRLGLLTSVSRQRTPRSPRPCPRSRVFAALRAARIPAFRWAAPRSLGSRMATPRTSLPPRPPVQPPRAGSPAASAPEPFLDRRSCTPFGRSRGVLCSRRRGDLLGSRVGLRRYAPSRVLLPRRPLAPRRRPPRSSDRADSRPRRRGGSRADPLPAPPRYDRVRAPSCSLLPRFDGTARRLQSQPLGRTPR